MHSNLVKLEASSVRKVTTIILVSFSQNNVDLQQMTLVTLNILTLTKKGKMTLLSKVLPPLLNPTEFDHIPTEHKSIELICEHEKIGMPSLAGLVMENIFFYMTYNSFAPRQCYCNISLFRIIFNFQAKHLACEV